MSINAINSGSYAPTGATPRATVVKNYFDKLNDKFSRLNLKEGRYRSITPSILETETKPYVFIDPELLFSAAKDEELSDQLYDKLKDVSQWQKALEEKFDVQGRKLTESGFTIDKKGNIIARGKAKINDKEGSFSVTLGNVKEKFVDITARLTNRFEVQAFQLLNLTA